VSVRFFANDVVTAKAAHLRAGERVAR